MIQDWLSAAVSTDPERPFLSIDGVEHTFGQVAEMADIVAGGLAAQGVKPGDRVALWALNDLDSVVALFAIWRTGSACVLVNTRLTDSEVEDQLAEAGVTLLLDPDARQWTVPSVPVRLRGDPHPGQLHDPGSECLIVFTSGSGGRGRGVALTWANLDAGQIASGEHLGHTNDDVWLAVLPIFHVGGASILIRSAARRSKVVLIDRFEPVAIADALSEVTIASFVATQIGAILDLDERMYDVRAVLVGGGPAKQSLLDRAFGRGLGVLSTYGMTEAGSQIATSVVGQVPQRVVVPIPGAEIRLVDGSLEVRGPMVTTSYLDAPARNAEGWLPTGDLGESVGGGFRVTGRTSDVIISGGENVMAEEVKDALESIRSVRAAAVVGLRDETWGEIVAAAVELHDARVSFDELADQLRESLAGYKIPKDWRLVDSLPRTSLGKIRRQAVRNLFS